MKDLIELVLKYFPRYLAEMGSILAGPKRFIRERNTNAVEIFNDSLLFLGIGIVLYVLLTTSAFAAGTDIWAYLAAVAVDEFVVLILSASWLWVCWRFVGGKATFKSFFVTYAYYAGAITVVIAFVRLLPIGTIIAFDPALYTSVREAFSAGIPLTNVKDSTVVYVAGVLLAFGYLAVLCLELRCVGWFPRTEQPG